MAYFRTVILKRRLRAITDQIRNIYIRLSLDQPAQDNAEDLARSLGKIKRDALVQYTSGKIDEEGYKQVILFIDECMNAMKKAPPG